MERPHLTNDSGHASDTHRRWAGAQKFNRRTNDADYLDRWYAEQCGGCRYWIPLHGVFGSDWGACTNKESLLDRTLMFEHDGCDNLDAANTFGG